MIVNCSEYDYLTAVYDYEILSVALALPPVLPTEYPLPAPTTNLSLKSGVPFAPLHNTHPVGIAFAAPDHMTYKTLTEQHMLIVHPGAPGNLAAPVAPAAPWAPVEPPPPVFPCP